jgi:hypothetical protein
MANSTGLDATQKKALDRVYTDNFKPLFGKDSTTAEADFEILKGNISKISELQKLLMDKVNELKGKGLTVENKYKKWLYMVYPNPFLLVFYAQGKDEIKKDFSKELIAFCKEKNISLEEFPYKLQAPEPSPPKTAAASPPKAPPKAPAKPGDIAKENTKQKRRRRQQIFPPPGGGNPVNASGMPILGPIGPKYPNLFPDEDVTALHGDIANINACIGRVYAGQLLATEEDGTFETGERIRNYTPDWEPYKFGLYKMMESSGSNYDCLIHSFLTATCPNFRRLRSVEYFNKRGEAIINTECHKEQFATWFRIYVVPSMPNFRDRMLSQVPDFGQEGGLTDGEELKLRIFTPSVFLTNTEMGLLAQHYGIGILSFEGQGGMPTTRYMNHGMEHVYVLSNTHGSHFESVKALGGRYRISGDTAFKINTIVTSDLLVDNYAAYGIHRNASGAINKNVNNPEVRGRIRDAVHADLGIELAGENTLGTKAAVLAALRGKIDAFKVELRASGANIAQFQAEEAARIAAQQTLRAAQGVPDVTTMSQKNYINAVVKRAKNTGGSIRNGIASEANVELAATFEWLKAHPKIGSTAPPRPSAPPNTSPNVKKNTRQAYIEKRLKINGPDLGLPKGELKMLFGQVWNNAQGGGSRRSTQRRRTTRRRKRNI